MNEIETVLQEIEENLDLADVEQVKLFSDILGETKLKGKFEKMSFFTCEVLKQWKVERKAQKEKESRKGKDVQISRLVTYLQYFVSLFEALSCNSNVFRLFASSTNIANNIKLIPQDYFEKQSQNIKSFLKNNDFKEEYQTKLSLNNVNDLPGKIEELKLIKSEMESSVSVDELKNGFREICAMFELSTFFNDLLMKKPDNRNALDLSPNNELVETKRKLQKQIEENQKLSNELEKQQKIIKELQREEDILNKVKEANKRIEELENEREKTVLELAKSETCRIENAQLKSEIDSLNYQCLRLLNGFKSKKEEATNLKKKINKISAKYIQMNEKYELTKKLLDDSNAKISQSKIEQESNEKSHISLILSSLGINSSTNISNDVYTICDEIKKLKEANEEKEKKDPDIDDAFVYSSRALPSYSKTHAELDKTILNLANVSTKY